MSTNLSSFGLRKYLLEEHNYYFDTNYFYAIDKSNRMIRILLAEIDEVSHTNTKLSSGRIWQVKATHQRESLVFKFTNNYSLFNKSFAQFLEQVKEVNPMSVRAGLMF